MHRLLRCLGRPENGGSARIGFSPVCRAIDLDRHTRHARCRRAHSKERRCRRRSGLGRPTPERCGTFRTWPLPPAKSSDRPSASPTSVPAVGSIDLARRQPSEGPATRFGRASDGFGRGDTRAARTTVRSRTNEPSVAPGQGLRARALRRVGAAIGIVAMHPPATASASSAPADGTIARARGTGSARACHAIAQPVPTSLAATLRRPTRAAWWLRTPEGEHGSDRPRAFSAPRVRFSSIAAPDWPAIHPLGTS